MRIKGLWHLHLFGDIRIFSPSNLSFPVCAVPCKFEGTHFFDTLKTLAYGVFDNDEQCHFRKKSRLATHSL